MFLNEFVNFAQEQQCTCDLKILRKKKNIYITVIPAITDCAFVIHI